METIETLQRCRPFKRRPFLYQRYRFFAFGLFLSTESANSYFSLQIIGLNDFIAGKADRKFNVRSIPNPFVTVSARNDIGERFRVTEKTSFIKLIILDRSFSVTRIMDETYFYDVTWETFNVKRNQCRRNTF